MGNIELSIVLVTYNSSKIIGEALESIVKYNDKGQNIEIVIVDNASNDVAVVEALLTDFPLPLKFIKLPSNKGYGAGNNVGINNSSAPLILIMNPDVTLHQSVFAAICREFNVNPGLGILGMQQYENEAGLKNHSFIISSPNVLKLMLHKMSVKINYFNSTLFCFSGACFAIRKESFLQAGGYNEKIFLYGEESDLQYRLKKLAVNNAIKFVKSLGYIHKTHERNLSIQSHIEGIRSFLIIADSRGIGRRKMLNRIGIYYKFIEIYNSVKKCEAYHFYRELNKEILKLKNSL